MNKEEIINELKYWLNFEVIQINKIEVINIINLIKDIEQQNKNYKEVIDKIGNIISLIDELRKDTGGYPSDYIDKLLDILKEVE